MTLPVGIIPSRHQTSSRNSGMLNCTANSAIRKNDPTNVVLVAMI